jgi:hypothetical protein
MKIFAVEAEVWRIPVLGEVCPTRAPGTAWRDRTTTLDRLRTDAGLRGVRAGQGVPQLVRVVARDAFLRRMAAMRQRWGELR